MVCLKIATQNVDLPIRQTFNSSVALIFAIKADRGLDDELLIGSPRFGT
jgi:hypothetical protein